MKGNRTIFIWDIHWCLDELKLLLKKLKVKKNDRIFLTWDLINKWPKSYKTIKYVYKNSEQIKVVLWNHDYEFLEYSKKRKTKNNLDYLIEKPKFDKLLRKLKKHPKIFRFFKNIPLYIEEDNFLLIHWWLIPWKSLEEHKPVEICNIRMYKWKPWHEYYEWNKKIIYWHWAVAWLNIKENTIWLDSWCCYGNFLTAYILETWEIVKQKAIKQYVDPFKNLGIIARLKWYLNQIYANFKAKE